MYTFKVHFMKTKDPTKKWTQFVESIVHTVNVTTGHPSAPDISATDVQCKPRTGVMFVMRLIIEF